MNDNSVVSTDQPATICDQNRRLVLGGLLLGSTVLGTLALTAPFVVGAIRSPLPFMATPGRKVRLALEFVQRRRAKQSKLTSTFVDLGSGDGEAVFQAVKSGYKCAIGIELNYTLYILSQFRRFVFCSSLERNRSSFYCKNFFYIAPSFLNKADTVMIFGVNSLMKSISELLAQNCQQGTYILAYRFLIPLENTLSKTTHDPPNKRMEEHHVDTYPRSNDKPPTFTTPTGSSIENLLKAKLVYDEEEMRVYECTSTRNPLNQQPTKT